jgi:pantetheine-phosphate adenylyltransferase
MKEHKKTKVVYPGSFNPLQNGHVQVMELASLLYDKVYIFVANNPTKNYNVSTKDRAFIVAKFIQQSGLNNIHVTAQKDDSEHTIDYMKRHKINNVIRGVRAGESLSDVERMFEQSIHDSDETIDFHFVTTESPISSSIVRRAMSNGDPIGEIVPQSVVDEILRFN